MAVNTAPLTRQDTVRVPGDDGVRHDIQTLRQEMNARFDDMGRRFDDMVAREDEAHAAIGKRIDTLQDGLNRLLRHNGLDT